MLPNCPSCSALCQRSLGRRSDEKSEYSFYEKFIDDLQRFDRSIFACDRCGLEFIFPCYSSEDLAALYEGPGYRKFREYCDPADEASAVLSRVEKFRRLGLGVSDSESQEIGRRPRLLDVGCGEGLNLRAFERIGYDVTGVDMNPEFIDRLSADGFDVRISVMEDLSETGVFDIVSAFHLIEHLVDPHVLFTQARRLLKKGGCLIVETPFLEDSGRTSSRYRDPYHTLFFDHFSLAFIASMHQFYPVNAGHVQALDVDYHSYMVAIFRHSDQSGPTPDQLALLRPLFANLETEARSWIRGDLRWERGAIFRRAYRRLRRVAGRYFRKPSQESV